MLCRVIDWAIQVHGGAGVPEDAGLAEAYGHARTMRIFATLIIAISQRRLVASLVHLVGHVQDQQPRLFDDGSDECIATRLAGWGYASTLVGSLLPMNTNSLQRGSGARAEGPDVELRVTALAQATTVSGSDDLLLPCLALTLAWRARPPPPTASAPHRGLRCAS